MQCADDVLNLVVHLKFVPNKFNKKCRTLLAIPPQKKRFENRFFSSPIINVCSLKYDVVDLHLL